METQKIFSKQALQDFELIDSALSGDQRAYRSLFNRYWKQVYFNVSRIVRDEDEAKDVTMEAFARAFGNLHRFKKQNGFNTWLYRITKNHSLDFIKRNRLPTAMLPAFAVDSSNEPLESANACYLILDNMEQKLIENQRTATLRRHIEALPPIYQQVMVLRFYEEYSYLQMAAALQLPLGTIKARMHKARHLLGQSLTPYRTVV